MTIFDVKRCVENALSLP